MLDRKNFILFNPKYILHTSTIPYATASECGAGRKEKPLSKKKYKRGARLKTVGQFDTCGAEWYIVKYPNGKEKTTHRAWLISAQYRWLATYIKGGRIFVARLIKDNERN